MSASVIPALDQEPSMTEINSSSHQSSVDKNDNVVIESGLHTSPVQPPSYSDEKPDLLDIPGEIDPKSTSFKSSDDLELSIPKLGDQQRQDDDEETGILRSKRGATIAIVSSTAQMIDSI
jgi:hypothetical protein